MINGSIQAIARLIAVLEAHLARLIVANLTRAMTCIHKHMWAMLQSEIEIKICIVQLRLSSENRIFAGLLVQISAALTETVVVATLGAQFYIRIY